MFSCLQANIRLRRSVAYHVVQSYIPSAFIVVLSSVSFWLDRTAIHARITLWFTTLLSVYTVSESVKSNTPEVSSIKALDIWFGACFLFIICTLVEAAIVNRYMRKADKFERMAQSLALAAALSSSSGVEPRKRLAHNALAISTLTISFYAENPDIVSAMPSPRVQELRIGYEYSRRGYRVDQISRLLHPLLFSLFNFVYWLYYIR